MCPGNRSPLVHQEDQIALTLKVTDKKFEVINFSAWQPHDNATAEHLNFKTTPDEAQGSTGK